MSSVSTLQRQKRYLKETDQRIPIRHSPIILLKWRRALLLSLYATYDLMEWKIIKEITANNIIYKNIYCSGKNLWKSLCHIIVRCWHCSCLNCSIYGISILLSGRLAILYNMFYIIQWTKWLVQKSIGNEGSCLGFHLTFQYLTRILC